MLPADADPVLLDAQALAAETRTVRVAVLGDARRVGGPRAADELRAHPAWRAAHRVPHLSGQPDGLDEPDASEAWVRDVWSRLVAGAPAPLRPLLGELGVLLERRRALMARPEHCRAILRALDERARILRIAVAARQHARDAAATLTAADRVAARALESGREPTPGEARRIAELRDRAREPGRWEASIRTPAERDGVLAALGTLELRDAREQLRDGLLLTDQMLGILAEAEPALRRGEPMLLIGETGGGKTALAEMLCRHRLGREPELVSGYGDITSAQLIGAHELRAADGATVTEFVPGPLLRAMGEGIPLILDELNAMPPEFLKRLNRILQLRPGDRFTVQEDAGRPVTIAPGFAIIATANEQTPHRYRGLDRLSAELVNRFGANAYRVHYPDAGLPYGALPVENLRLAAAAVASPRGELPAALPLEDLERLARAAFVSQQVFAGSHGEGFDAYVSTEREIDGRPGLEESVLAPRTMVEIIRKVAGSAGRVSLDHALRRFVEGVMHAEDRRILALIATSQGFRLR